MGGERRGGKGIGWEGRVEESSGGDGSRFTALTTSINYANHALTVMTLKARL